MSDVLTRLYTKLKATSAVTAIVGESICPMYFPESTYPAVVYRQSDKNCVASFRDVSIEGYVTVEIDCVGGNYTQAKEIADAVRGALNGWYDSGGTPSIVSCKMISESDTIEFVAEGDNLATILVTQVYTIWFA